MSKIKTVFEIPEDAYLALSASGYSKEKKADLILLDEKRARKTARRAGFKVMGILGILVF